jgi:hypothetical protein
MIHDALIRLCSCVMGLINDNAFEIFWQIGMESVGVFAAQSVDAGNDDISIPFRRFRTLIEREFLNRF